jgi:hypothetical protein
MGVVATGKTAIRKERFSRGYVLVDAGEIFLSLMSSFRNFPTVPPSLRQT